VCYVLESEVIKTMRKTHAKKILEAVTDLSLASPNEIMDWIRNHYPNDNVNPSSYRADIIGCSANHSSSHHYPGLKKFLWFEEELKKYRLKTPKDSAQLKSTEKVDQPHLESKEEFVDGIPVAKISITGQIAIPSVVREKLGLKPGDLLAFIINDNILEIRKAKITIEYT
jgi:AbrB family looped-hinge helix DNA binding protein